MLDINTRYTRAVHEQLAACTPDKIRPYKNFYIEPVYTLVARPPDHIRKKVIEFSQHLAHSLSGNYHYDSSQLHVTLQLLGVEINSQTIPLIETTVKNKEVSVIAQGIGINAHGISVPTYEITPHLITNLRNELRSKLNVKTDYKEHDPVWDELLWINFMRFKHRPSVNSLKLLQQYKNQLIGKYNINQWQLYKTSSRVLDPKQSELIHTFNI